jgi:hypothetical protein
MGPILVADHPHATAAPVFRRIDCDGRHPAQHPAARSAGRLQDRARRLRHLAAQAPGPLAVAYRRRACELDLLDAVTGPLPIDPAG